MKTLDLPTWDEMLTAFMTRDASFDGIFFTEAFASLFGSAPTAARRDRVVTIDRIPTPLGPILAGASDDGVCLAEFVDRRMLATQLNRLRGRLGCHMVPGRNTVIEILERELDAYFNCGLREFSVPLICPGTEFQLAVWKALQNIPYGETVSYGDLARTLGRPTAVRAVARANGDNRIAILIPCHRVIGHDGRLTGYGGGLWRKQRLLELEGGWSPPPGSAQLDLFESDRGDASAE